MSKEKQLHKPPSPYALGKTFTWFSSCSASLFSDKVDHLAQPVWTTVFDFLVALVAPTTREENWQTDNYKRERQIIYSGEPKMFNCPIILLKIMKVGLWIKWLRGKKCLPQNPENLSSIPRTQWMRELTLESCPLSSTHACTVASLSLHKSAHICTHTHNTNTSWTW